MPARCDLLVIGGGLAGLTAARHAQRRGLATVVASFTPGSLPHTSGAVDLLAVYPTETKRYREQPWEAVAELIAREPDHPYARVGLGRLRDAWGEFLALLAASPLRYHHRGDRNLLLVTAAGTLKPTFAVPGSMRANVEAWERKEPALILGIRGLPGFAAEQVVGNLQDRWFGLRADWLDVVGGRAAEGLAELYGRDQRVTAPRLAAQLELGPFRERFAEAVRARLQGARAVGLPAVLGYDRVMDVCADLSDRIGAPVFEIPMITPTLPGIRLADLMLRAARESGATLLRGRAVAGLERCGDGPLSASLADPGGARDLEADQVLLATGRFFGGGLQAVPGGVYDAVLHLPVRVPPHRDDWHMGTFLGAPGHPLNRAGLEVDAAMQVLDPAAGGPLPGVRAAGAILAHHDWVREKSGAGISVTTAFAAVEAMPAPTSSPARSAP